MKTDCQSMRMCEFFSPIPGGLLARLPAVPVAFTVHEKFPALLGEICSKNSEISPHVASAGPISVGLM